jgi:hypothetical protein
LISENYWASTKFHLVSFLGTVNYGHANKIFRTENYWRASAKCSCHLVGDLGTLKIVTVKNFQIEIWKMFMPSNEVSGS